jgi:mannose-6-phosphate isomerase-like protein (cupin superfamily)
VTGDTINLSAAQTLRVMARTPETLELESTWATGGSPPRIHWHPRQHEHFEVLEGELTVEVGGEPPQVLRPRDRLEVPPRTAHRMWNAGTERVRVTWRISPALRTEEMFRYIDRGMSPLRSVRMLWTYRREFRLGNPPQH